MKRDKGAGQLSRMYCPDRVPDTQRPCIHGVILGRGPGRTLVLRGLLCASSLQSSERGESVCKDGSEACSFSQEKAHGVGAGRAIGPHLGSLERPISFC